jgi:hypothetical protein
MNRLVNPSNPNESQKMKPIEFGHSSNFPPSPDKILSISAIRWQNVEKEEIQDTAFSWAAYTGLEMRREDTHHVEASTFNTYETGGNLGMAQNESITISLMQDELSILHEQNYGNDSFTTSAVYDRTGKLISIKTTYFKLGEKPNPNLVSVLDIDLATAKEPNLIPLRGEIPGFQFAIDYNEDFIRTKPDFSEMSINLEDYYMEKVVNQTAATTFARQIEYGAIAQTVQDGEYPFFYDGIQIENISGHQFYI